MRTGNGWGPDESVVESPRVKQLKGYLTVLSQAVLKRRKSQQLSSELNETLDLCPNSIETEDREVTGNGDVESIEEREESEWDISQCTSAEKSDSSGTTEASEISLRSINKEADFSETSEPISDHETPDIDTRNSLESLSSFANRTDGEEVTMSFNTVKSTMEMILDSIVKPQDTTERAESSMEDSEVAISSIEHRRMQLFSYPIDLSL